MSVVLGGCLVGESFPEGEDIEGGEFVYNEGEVVDCGCPSGNDGYRTCEDVGWGDCQFQNHSW